MTAVNLFTHYIQLENHFTNALIGLLRVSQLESPTLVPEFFRSELGITSHHPFRDYRVLGEIEGTHDGEIVSADCCVQFEAKIASATLRADQIRRHLRRLNRRREPIKRLVLLTPDDGRSRYVSQFLQIDEQSILHLAWKQVHDWLDAYIQRHPSGAFVEMVRQFLELLKAEVFEEDFVGIVLKIDFGDKSEVYSGDYLEKLRSGKWRSWNTPREYKRLNGTGRKLLMYDRTRKAITAEVEIRKVEETNRERDYPWTNFFEPKTIVVYDSPIPVEHVRTLEGFENFGVYRKDRSAYRNVTHEQYRLLRLPPKQ